MTDWHSSALSRNSWVYSPILVHLDGVAVPSLSTIKLSGYHVKTIQFWERSCASRGWGLQLLFLYFTNGSNYGVRTTWYFPSSRTSPGVHSSSRPSSVVGVAWMFGYLFLKMPQAHLPKEPQGPGGPHTPGSPGILPQTSAPPHVNHSSRIPGTCWIRRWASSFQFLSFSSLLLSSQTRRVIEHAFITPFSVFCFYIQPNDIQIWFK